MSYIVVGEQDEVNLNMEELTPATPAHADRFNERFKQVLENENVINEKCKKADENFKNISEKVGDLKFSVVDGILNVTYDDGL